MAVSGSLITRKYTNFRGIDFSNREVNLSRSPDALNVWKNYKNNIGKMIETRPSTELLKTFSDTVYGFFFYKVNTQEHLVVHSGTKLYDLREGIVTKNDNIQEFDLFYDDIETSITSTTFEWLYQDTTPLPNKAHQFQIVFGTDTQSNKYITAVRYEYVKNILSKYYLYGFWKNTTGNKYVFVEDTTQLPEFMSSTDFTYYGEKHIVFEDTLPPQGVPGTTLPIVMTAYTKTEMYSGLAPVKGTFFVYNNILYYKENTKYVQFNGTTASDVVGYIPTTSISRTPTGGGAIYEDVNMLSPFRKNEFVGDGTSTEYHLDSPNIDSVSEVKVNGVVQVYSTDYTYNTTDGTVTFVVAPPIPDTDGQSNVVITYQKVVSGYADRILKCSIVTTFDNRVFFSGNPTYPNVVWHSSLNDPTYISDLDYYNEGLDLAAVKALVPGNEALWVFKEPSQANTTVFYHEPSIDSTYGKIYPSVHSSISTGCVATGINFNDDIVFFSHRGMEAIEGSVTGDRVLSHRSSLVDSKLLSESNYESLILAEWEGYLLIIIDNKVYLADSRAMFTNEEHNEYEWFYWELGITPTCTQVKDDVLYIGTSNGIYKLTDFSSTRVLNSYWTTPLDGFNYTQMQKTTNKKGSLVKMEGESITVSARTDNNNFELINTYQNTKGYVVCRIKRKKWHEIQLKFASTKPFGIYEATLESYVGSYVKR